MYTSGYFLIIELTTTLSISLKLFDYWIEGLAALPVRLLVVDADRVSL